MSREFGNRCDGPLCQGEILQDLHSYIPSFASTKISERNTGKVDAKRVPYALVVSPACDLEQDYKVRFPSKELEEEQSYQQKLERNSISFVLCLRGFTQEEIRSLTASGRDIRRRIDQNQDERYHRLGPALVEDSDVEIDLYFDFKRIIPFPTQSLYAAFELEAKLRLAVVKEPYILDLIHRSLTFSLGLRFLIKCYSSVLKDEARLRV